VQREVDALGVITISRGCFVLVARFVQEGERDQDLRLNRDEYLGGRVKTSNLKVRCAK